MFVAGAATLPRGNLGGLIMLLTGVLLLLVGFALGKWVGQTVPE